MRSNIPKMLFIFIEPNNNCYHTKVTRLGITKFASLYAN